EAARRWYRWDHRGVAKRSPGPQPGLAARGLNADHAAREPQVSNVRKKRLREEIDSPSGGIEEVRVVAEAPGTGALGAAYDVGPGGLGNRPGNPIRGDRFEIRAEELCVVWDHEMLADAFAE